MYATDPEIVSGGGSYRACDCGSGELEYRCKPPVHSEPFSVEDCPDGTVVKIMAGGEEIDVIKDRGSWVDDYLRIHHVDKVVSNFVCVVDR